MTTIKAVKEAEADPKVGKARARSGVSFPYWDLDSVIEVAKIMHERAGGVCDNVQLAALLGYSGIGNGSYRTRVSATKMFGVIESTDDGKLRVSDRGRRIVAPVTPADEITAKLEAFLAIDLFKRVFDRYNGTTIPEKVGLRHLFANEYHVVPDRIAPTVRIMLDSAQQAGLFDTLGNRSKMVMPLSVSTQAMVTPPKPPPASDAATNAHHGGGGNGGDGGSGGGGGAEIDPALLGLLRRLPTIGTTLNSKRRKTVIDAFTAFVALVYPDDESGG